MTSHFKQRSSLALAVTALVAATSCGASSSSSHPDTPAARYFELAPVVSHIPGRCPPAQTGTRQLEGVAQAAGNCYVLDDRIVDGRDVALATATATPVKPETTPDRDWAVYVVLSGPGTERLNRWTSSHVGGELAVITQGKLRRVATVNAEPYSGTVVVGDLTEEQAQALAAAGPPPR